MSEVSTQGNVLARRTVRDYVVYLPSLLVPGLINMALVPFLTRRFQPDSYGNYVLAIGVLQMLPTVFSLWIEASVLRFISHHRGRELAYLRIVALLLVVISLIVLIGGWLILTLWPSGSAELASFYLLAVLAFPARAALDACLNYFRAAGQAATYSLFRIIRVVMAVGIGLLLTYLLSWDIRAFLVGMLSTELGLAAVAVVLVLRCTKVEDQRADLVSLAGPVPLKLRTTLQQMLRYGIPIAGLNLAAMVLSIGDRYILEHYLGSAAVGVYNAGYVVPEALLRLVSMSIATATTPIVFERWEQHGAQGLQRYLSQLLWGYLCLATPLWLLMVVLRTPIRLLMTPGAAYAAVTDLMPVVALAVLIHGCTMLLNLAFYSRIESHIPFQNALVAAATNIALNFVLIPRIGLWGAAIATVVSYTALLVLTVSMTRSKLSLSFGRTKPVALAAASAALVLVSVLAWKWMPVPGTFFHLALASVSGLMAYGIVLLRLDRDWRRRLIGISSGKQIRLTKLR